MDHGYLIAILSFVAALMLDLGATRPVRRPVRAGAS